MSLASRVIVATSLTLTLGVGCGSSGGGCGGLVPLPADPKPHGFPPDQLIEGGLQARITKPGVDKLLKTITSMVGGLASGTCVGENTLVDVLDQRGGVCNGNDCAGGAKGCPVRVYLDSTQRPAPNNNQDGKLRVLLSLNDSPPAANPQVTVDASFDVDVPLRIWWDTLVEGSCVLRVNSKHVTDDAASPPRVEAKIDLGISPTTGELTLGLADLRVLNLGLDSSGCSVVGWLVDAVLSFIDGVLTSFIGDFVLDLLRPQLNDFLQSLLPKPLGLAGTFNAGSILAGFNPPKDTNLELFIVPGGYVQSKAGGLTLGVMSGLNSDRDQTTRAPGMTSEPSLCVPVRPTPDLAAQPWNLPFNVARKDFTLNPAGPFAGTPEPTDATGALKDVAIGVSRTFLDLAGFHIYNSGTLCLAIGGDAVPQLNSGTLSVIVGSLGNILENRKAPLSLVLRPQTPVSFTIGEGTMADSLLHVGLQDLRIDFYAFIEERYVRLLTMALDLNVGINLDITKTMSGGAAIQPILSGIDAKNVTIRISNTDLLQESPKDLEAVFPSLINIATGALGGAIDPIPLPEVAGFSLTDLSVGRVQTNQDDFLGIFASIMTGMPAARVDWSDPLHPRAAGELRTIARVAALHVPTQEELRSLFSDEGLARLADAGARPSVTLELDVERAPGKPVEFGWRIDGGMWRPWTKETRPTLADDAFLLQGRHTIEVRSRVAGDFTTEDSTPVKLDVLIDSVPPELHPRRDGDEVLLGGFDIVSPEGALAYAWLDADGRQTPWTQKASLPVAEVKHITGAKRPFTVFARDEAGNIGQAVVDPGDLLGFHGRTTDPVTGGCGSCAVGGADRGAGAKGALALALLVLLVRLRRRSKALLAAGLAVLGLELSGCGCDGNALACNIDDDCAQMQCAAGELASCQENQCACIPDQTLGDVGRYASMALLANEAYVAAYNTTYGDLMIGHVSPPGVVSNWEFVDGVPDEPPDNPRSHARGGVSSKGDDVGRYTSLQITPRGEPVIAYYDKSHGSLKFASFGVIRWRSHVVDRGGGSFEGGKDDVGRWAQLTIGPDGRPGIAYIAIIQQGTMSGMPEGQLRFAEATVTDPQRPEDWTITTLDARPLGVPMTMPDMGAPDDEEEAVEPLYPDTIALMLSVARKSDGSPGIVYYDRARGNLRYIHRLADGSWTTPIIADGEDAMGNDTGDVGLYPSLVYDEEDVAHATYVDATRDNLLYINSKDGVPEVIDDGYRPNGEMTTDGLDSPVFHLVGDSSSIQTASGQLFVAYQDSTVLQLRIARRGADGKWTHQQVAGHANPFKGAYGFWSQMRTQNGRGVIATYAINQQLDLPLFFVEVFSVDLGIIL